MKTRFSVLTVISLAALCVATGCSAPIKPEVHVVEDLVITNPSAGLYTNASTLLVEVQTPGDISGLQLLANMRIVAENAQSPIEWKTQDDADGTVELRVRALRAGQLIESTPITITLDRVSPEIIEMYPVQGDLTASSDVAPWFRVSEALDPDSIGTAECINAAGSTTASLTLSENAERVTLDMNGTLPTGAWEIRLPALRDLAGNALLSPAWSWLSPEVLTWRIPFGGLRPYLAGIAVHANGTIRVGIPNDLVCTIFDVTEFGLTQTVPTLATDCSYFRIATAPDDALIAAYRAPGGLYVRRYNGVAWEDMGTQPLDPEGVNPFFVPGTDNSLRMSFGRGDGALAISRWNPATQEFEAEGIDAIGDPVRSHFAAANSSGEVLLVSQVGADDNNMRASFYANGALTTLLDFATSHSYALTTGAIRAVGRSFVLMYRDPNSVTKSIRFDPISKEWTALSGLDDAVWTTARMEGTPGGALGISYADTDGARFWRLLDTAQGTWGAPALLNAEDELLNLNIGFKPGDARPILLGSTPGTSREVVVIEPN